ncbi:MAG: type I methionyl aminopeptidase [Spirochaetes bacterium]|jgi:methionyl aminopeptidase|nr:type I methionyl aminopeptidase [Spirochaetota bacterium]
MKSGLLKSTDDIERIAESGAILRSLFAVLTTLSFEGLSTWKVDSVIENYITSHGGRPSFHTLPGYRFASCISINAEVAHGIPSKKKLIKSGDIVSIDVGVVKNGYFSDACRTFIVGTVNEELHYLVQKNRMALNRAVSMMNEGMYLKDIGETIAAYAQESRLVVLEEFTGHGVGYAMHELPVVFHGAGNTNKIRLKAGMVLAIEPVFTFKKCSYLRDEDGWTIRTDNGCYTSQFEETVAITVDGPRVLT